MYLDDIAVVIRTHIPESRMPKGNAEELLLIYAVLARAKGVSITQSDVHDAWSAWMSRRNDQHESLVEYEKLAEDVRKEDEVFVTAIRRAAEQLLCVRRRQSGAQR